MSSQQINCILNSDIILVTLFFSLFSVQKTIERYRTYTKDNVSNKTVQQDIEVTWLYFLLGFLWCLISILECRFYQAILSILWIILKLTSINEPLFWYTFIGCPLFPSWWCFYWNLKHKTILEWSFDRVQLMYSWIF